MSPCAYTAACGLLIKEFTVYSVTSPETLNPVVAPIQHCDGQYNAVALKD